MLESLTEVLPELAYAVLAVALTVFGLVIESLSAQNFQAGETTMGLWLTFVGVVALYAGLKVAQEKALPAFR